MPRWAIANNNAVGELPVAAIGMLGVVSFNCDACHSNIIIGGEPSWMRFEPAINAGVAHSIYVGGATASMGSLQNFSTQHKTRNQEFFGSIHISFSELNQEFFGSIRRSFCCPSQPAPACRCR